MSPLRFGKAPAWILAGLFLLGGLVLLRRPPVLPPTGSGAAERRETPAGPLYAMWVWDARLVTDSVGRSRLLAFSRKHGLQALYLSAYDLRSPMDQHYRQFNRLAHRQGIRVYALAGDPRWGKPQYHRVPMEWMESVRRLNASAPPEERFDGIHTDVEVYLLSKSWKEHPEVLLGGYLDLNAKMAAVLKADPRPMEFGVDIPFWFDDDASYRILWHGQIKVPAQHVLDTVDHVTVMAYRNFSEGSDGTVHLVSLEMDYADRLGKKVTIGQETQENLFPAYITFGGTSCQVLHREMDKIYKVVGHRPSFGGFAVHHYESYKKLCGES